MAVLTAVALRIAWVAYANVDPNDGRFDDSVFYHNVGHLLARGSGYTNPWLGGPTAQWPPAYPAALAVLYKVFGWELVWAKALNIGCAAVTVVLIYLIGRRLFDRRVGYAGALVLALFPGQIYFSTLVLTETIFAMVFVLVLLLVLLWTVERQDGAWWQPLIIGLLVGGAAMIRAEGILLLPIVIALWLLTVRPWGRLLDYVPALLLGAVLALTPWTARNASAFGEFIPLRPSPDGIAAIGLSPDFEEYRPAAGLPPPSLSDSVGHWVAHPWELPSFGWHKMRVLYKNDEDGIFWVQSRQGVLSETSADRWSRLANVYFFTVGALALLAIPLCLGQERKRRVAIPVFGLGWSLMFLIFAPQTRYHFPVGPLAALLAAALLVFVWDSIAAVARRRTISTPAGTPSVSASSERPAP